MKKTCLPIAIALMFAAMTISTHHANAQVMSQEEMMAMMMELAQPGPEHEWLAKSAGNWRQEIKFWEAPGTEPQTTSGTCKREMILGGRFMMETSKFPMMGQDVEMMIINGYDRRSEKFTSLGLDTMGTYYISSTGTYDAETKTLTLKGVDKDPMTGMVNNFTQTVKYLDDDTQVFSMVFSFEGMGMAPFKVVEVTYKRIKSDR